MTGPWRAVAGAGRQGVGQSPATSAAAIARRTSPRAARHQVATATHTQTRAKSVMPAAPMAAPVAKLDAAYMPTGNTVAQRDGS